MRNYAPAHQSALNAAPDAGIAPAWFLWIAARDRDTGTTVHVGLWSGDEPITVTVAPPGGAGEARTYQGEVGLRVDPITSGIGLEDRPVTVMLSQIADQAQFLVRTLDARHAYCELHLALRNGGALVAPPQLEFVGIIDEAPITTPAVGGEGAITLSIRDELMTQLTAVNPARSSDAHQRRRQAGDEFSRYSGVIGSRELEWYRK